MPNKTFNTRLQLKTDTYANWSNTSVQGKGGNLVLLKGEIAFCVVESSNTGVATNPPTILFKVGDGVTPFKDLTWGSALSADVYDWAKSSTKPNYTASEVGALPVGEKPEYQIIKNTSAGAGEHSFILQTKSSNASQWTNVSTLSFGDIDTNQKVKVGSTTFGDNDAIDFEGTGAATVTATNSGTTKKITINVPEVTAASLGLSNAMHFLGSTTTAITDGSTTKPISIGSNASYNPVSGDVVLSGHKEFVWNGSSWELLGDEGSYLVGIETTDDGVVDLAVSGTGTTKTIDAKHAKKGPAGGATKGATADLTINGTNKTGSIKVPKVVADEYGHVTGLTEQTLSITLPDTPEHKILNTNNTTKQTPVADEAITGSGTINLHKVSKTGLIEDLIQENVIIFNCGTATTVI